MTVRPLYPFVSRLQFVHKETGLLTPATEQNLTPPQLMILDSIEKSFTGGEIRVVGGTRTLAPNSPYRAIILKARQMGVSTITEGTIFAISQLIANSRSLIVSHDLDSSRHLLDMTRRYWETSWICKEGIHTPRNAAQGVLSWHEPDSMIRVTTAKNAASARSHTLRAVHASEVAFWDNAKELMKGLAQSVPRSPKTFIFMESTANGVGNYFQETWDAAVDGDNFYLPLFYAWWQHPGYEAQHIGLAHMLDRPLRNFSSDERALIKGFRRLGIDETRIKAKLIWRREILATECFGDIDTFRQEYPSTPDEAFVASGRNVFPRPHLDAAYEPMEGETGMLVAKAGRVEFVPDRLGGKLTIFRHPNPSSWYSVGGDAAKQAKGDYAVASVLDRSTWEQVAEFRDDVDPITFAEQLILLGHYYNEALLVPETNMSGGVVAEVARANYDNLYIHQAMATVRGQMANQYGFNTNTQTKPEVIGNLKRALVDRFSGNSTITFHSKHLYREMRGYVLEDGKYQNSSNPDEADHDDTVMAFGLALIGAIHNADDDDRRPMPSVGTRRRSTRPVDEAEMGARRIAALMDVTPAMPTLEPVAGGEWADEWPDDEPANDRVLASKVTRGRARSRFESDLDGTYEPWGD